MAKYKTIPIVIEAEIYHKGLENGFVFDYVLFREGYNLNNLITYKFGDVINANFAFTNEELERNVIPYIHTQEGVHYVAKDEYIITYVNGEKTFMAKDIFYKTYEII